MKSDLFDIFFEKIGRFRRGRFRECDNVIKILKACLFSYVICISKVVFEEIENLRDDNYLFLEYLKQNGFEYDLERSYSENMKILSEKIELFNGSYNFIFETKESEEILNSLRNMELDLKLDILRGKYIKITQNFISKAINLPIIREETGNFLLEIFNEKNNKILYSVEFFLFNYFGDVVIHENEKIEISKILFSMTNSNNNNKIVMSLRSVGLQTREMILKLFNENDKIILNRNFFTRLPLEVREEVIRNNWIETVIAMPCSERIRSMETVILNKKRESKEDNILFIRTETFFERNNKIKPESYERLLEIFKERKEINGISKVVSNEKILLEKHLSILNYVYKTKEKVDLKELEYTKKELCNKMERKRKECDSLIEEYLLKKQ
jgi:hypothetical protein